MPNNLSDLNKISAFFYDVAVSARSLEINFPGNFSGGMNLVGSNTSVVGIATSTSQQTSDLGESGQWTLLDQFEQPRTPMYSEYLGGDGYGDGEVHQATLAPVLVADVSDTGDGTITNEMAAELASLDGFTETNVPISLPAGFSAALIEDTDYTGQVADGAHYGAVSYAGSTEYRVKLEVLAAMGVGANFGFDAVAGPTQNDPVINFITTADFVMTLAQDSGPTAPETSWTSGTLQVGDLLEFRVTATTVIVLVNDVEVYNQPPQGGVVDYPGSAAPYPYFTNINANSIRIHYFAYM